MNLSNHSSVADLLNPIIFTIRRVPKTLATDRYSAFSQCEKLHIIVYNLYNLYNLKAYLCSCSKLFW